MASAISSEAKVIDGGAFKSYQSFRERMTELEQILEARHALAIVEYINQYTETEDYRENRKNLPQHQLVENMAKYSRSHPGYAPRYHALNEGSVVLLSAYLEGFVEELHAEVMRQLLNERIESGGVLQAFLEYAHRRFSNPTPDRIKVLFTTCGIKNIISKLTTDKEKIVEFVEMRNAIAHGEHVEVAGQAVQEWVELISRFAEELSLIVEREITAMKLGK